MTDQPMTDPTYIDPGLAAPSRRRRWPIVAVVAALLVAAGVTAVLLTRGGGSSVSAANLTAAQLAEKAGCNATGPGDGDKPLFIQDIAVCTDPTWSTDADHVAFYVFGNNDGRDGWLRLAQTFGDVGVIKGDRWAVEVPDELPNLPAVVAAIQAKIGGDRFA